MHSQPQRICGNGSERGSSQHHHNKKHVIAPFLVTHPAHQFGFSLISVGSWLTFFFLIALECPECCCVRLSSALRSFFPQRPRFRSPVPNKWFLINGPRDWFCGWPNNSISSHLDDDWDACFSNLNPSSRCVCVCFFFICSCVLCTNSLSFALLFFTFARKRRKREKRQAAETMLYVHGVENGNSDCGSMSGVNKNYPSNSISSLILTHNQMAAFHHHPQIGDTVQSSSSMNNNGHWIGNVAALQNSSELTANEVNQKNHFDGSDLSIFTRDAFGGPKETDNVRSFSVNKLLQNSNNGSGNDSVCGMWNWLHMYSKNWSIVCAWCPCRRHQQFSGESLQIIVMFCIVVERVADIHHNGIFIRTAVTIHFISLDSIGRIGASYGRHRPRIFLRFLLIKTRRKS